MRGVIRFIDDYLALLNQDDKFLFDPLYKLVLVKFTDLEPNITLNQLHEGKTYLFEEHPEHTDYLDSFDPIKALSYIYELY